MKKMFLIAIMALGTVNVFASPQPIQGGSAKKFIKKNEKKSPLVCCTVIVYMIGCDGQASGSTACAATKSEACDIAFKEAKAKELQDIPH